MSEAQIGPYCTISDDVKFGKNVILYGHANLYGCEVDDDSRIGPFVEIQCDVRIGKRVRVQSHTFICSGIDIEDDVFVGHNVNFINDRYPTATKAISKEWKMERTIVRKGVTIGTGAIIMCGIEIGEGSVIGAGSVVTKSIPPHTIVTGVPARIQREILIQDRGNGGDTVTLRS